jgi:protein gp37
MVGPPWLDWQLLTKRATAIHRLLPPDVAALPNVWPGVSVENTDFLGRVEQLLALPCAGPRFVSYEPALGPVDFRPYLGPGRIEWIVVGGESGAKGRPFAVSWAARTILDARDAGVAVFVKQFGKKPVLRGSPMTLSASKGNDMDEWLAPCRVRQYPKTPEKPR